MASAPVGLALTRNKSVLQMAQAIGKAKRPSVIWLHFQDCTGCTETLLRTSAPDVAHLILEVMSLDYHGTLRAASGAQPEAALRSAMADNADKYVLVVEGAIPTGVFMQGGAVVTPGLEGRCIQGRGGDRHRFLRFVRQCAVGRSKSHGCGKRRLRRVGQTNREPARLSRQSL